MGFFACGAIAESLHFTTLEMCDRALAVACSMAVGVKTLALLICC